VATPQLEQAQSFIVQRFQREASVRIQHNRMGDAFVALHWSHFCRTLFVQLFLPVCSVYWAIRGRTAVLRNVEMLPSHPMCYIQTILFLLVCESVVAYNLEVSHRVVTLPSVLILCFEYLMLRGVTALKYAFLHPSMYSRWIGRDPRTGSIPIPDDTRRREGMLAWMTADKHHIADEIEATADRLGVNLHDCSFSIIQEGSATPQTPAQYQTARKQLWKVADVVSEIVFGATSVRYVETRVMPASLVLAIAHAMATSGLGEAIVNNSYGDVVPDAQSGFLMAGVFLADFYMVFGLVAYGFAALVDYQHSYDMLNALQRLCEYQTPCRMHDNEPVADTPPRVSLLLSENVHMFLLTRRVLLNIGLRYRKRLQAFTSGLMIGVLVFAVFCLVAGLGGTLKPTLFMWHMVANVGAVIVLLLACLFKGAATNQLTEKHAALLDARALEVAAALGTLARGRGSRRDAGNGEVDTIVQEQLEDCERSLELVGKQLQYDLALRAVTLVGVRATPAFVRTAVVFGATMSSLVLRVLLASGV